MPDWRDNLIEDDDQIHEILERARRVAVLGIKTEEAADQPAYTVPRYLQRAGYEIVPVPVYYPEATEILGEEVYREVAEIPGTIDVVDVFRRPDDIPQHVPDLIAAQPDVVWFQLGIRNDDAARELAAAGIRVVQDHCMRAEHEQSR